MMKVWTAFLLVCAAASVVAWAVTLCHENRVCPFAVAARFVRGLPWGGRLALLPLFVALIVYGGTKTENVGANQFSGRVESVEGVDNVANVEVLPVTNPNTQLENDTGNWQQSYTGNINNSHLSLPKVTVSRGLCFQVLDMVRCLILRCRMMRLCAMIG